MSHVRPLFSLQFLLSIFLSASILLPCTAQVPITVLPRKGKCPNLGLGPVVICQRYDVTCQVSCPANQIGVIPGQSIIAHLGGGIGTDTCARGDVLIALASVLCNNRFTACGGICYATVAPSNGGP